MDKHLNSKIITGGLIAIVLFSFLNFQLIPIAWLDEIMDIDPAFRFLNGQGFNSLVWPYENTDVIFVANLPVRNLVYIIANMIGGAEYHWIRLFSYLLFVCFVFIAFKLFKNSFPVQVVSLILLIFILDKGVYESIRSVRPELIQLIFLSLGLWYLTVKKWPLLTLISQSFLFLTHPASWVLSACISLYALFQLKKPDRIITGMIVFCIPLFIWLWIFDFPFQDIRNQLLVAGDAHSSQGSIFLKLKNHLFDRYWPQYMAQPWVWLMYLTVHVISINVLIQNFRKRAMPDIWALMFICHSLYWLFMLAPTTRYNSTTLFLTYFIFTRFVFNLSFVQNIKLKPIITLVFLLIHSLPFAGISFLAITQYQERLPNPVFKWLDEQVESDKTVLIGGESVAAYWTYKPHIKSEYFEPIYPQHINFQRYNEIYILNREDLPYQKINEYQVENHMPDWIQKLHHRSGSHTYNGLILFKLSSIEAEEFCLKARKNNDWERYYKQKAVK
jgi:hypothetical protein